jgi:hypothetical protein
VVIPLTCSLACASLPWLRVVAGDTQDQAVEVHGSRVLRHTVASRTVLDDRQPQLDEQEPDAEASPRCRGAQRASVAGTAHNRRSSHHSTAATTEIATKTTLVTTLTARGRAEIPARLSRKAM